MNRKTYKLKDLMTKNPIVVDPEKTALDVSEIFRIHKFHHLPVVENDGKIVGIVSRTDLDQHAMGMSLFANQSRQEYTDAMFETLLVQYFMTKVVRVLGPDNSIEDAYNLFSEKHFRALPIVEQNQLIGIITPIDLVRPFLAEH